MRSERDNPGASKPGLAGTSFWLVLLALSVIVFGANTGVASWQGSRYAGASTDAANIQLLSQRLAVQGREAVATGHPEAFAGLRQNKAGIDNALNSLQSKFGNRAGVSGPLRQMTSAWSSLGKNVDQIVASEPAASALFENMDGLVNGIPEFQKTLNEVIRAMVVGGSPSTQIDKVLELAAESGAMISQVADIRAGRAKAEDSAEQFALTAQRFNQTLDGLQNGDPELGITAIHNNPAAVSGLRRAQSQWGAIRQNIDAILENTKSLSGAQTAAVELNSGIDSMIGYSKSLLNVGSTRDRRVFPNVWLGAVSGLISLLSIIGLTISLNRSQRREQELRYQTQHEFNSRNQQAIMRLLDEISSLGEGDLTVRASVTEDMTGAIADAVNYAVEELRNLVTTINDTSVQVAASSQETQATAMQLAEAANHQAEQISAASERINEIASSIQKVSRNSTESAEVAQRSVLIAAEGAGVVRETIKGMDQIRGQIQETSKRIKRLGESSQEIGSIVELINDISEQTNILALNAAVQAASAGEAGRGFAVVADEVQRLAERTSGATRRIEGLVQTIQADTNEAVNSMEQTTAEVVSGARLAEDAGTALAEIERVSNDLNELIKNISAAAQQQSTAAADITRTMELIRQITTQTSRGASQTAESIGHLTQLATDLRRSVADFKLPE